MDVDRAFRGNFKKTVELFDDGMCDGPELEVGKQYLMYTSGDPNSAVPARGCNRSRRVENADEDLSFLKKYTAGEVSTHVDVSVFLLPDGPHGTQSPDSAPRPLKDVLVTLKGNGKEFRGKTTSVGSYEFTGLTEGEYSLSAELEGFRSWALAPVKLAANGCATASIGMMVDRRVEGYVRDDVGVPVAGALIEMIAAQGVSNDPIPILLDVSDENGRYLIDHIPPGEYYLGVNLNSTPTPEQPYLATFYPNTPDRERAMRIGFVGGASVREYDLQAPPKLARVTVHGRILAADRKPPLLPNTSRILVNGSQGGPIGALSIEFDADGQFRLDLCEGVEYTVFAFSGPTGPQIYSQPIRFVPSKEKDALVLILDKTEEEFSKLRDR